jgi:hypothetical protein
MFGINTVCIPNPLFSDIKDIRQNKLDSLNVIWVGRFSIEKRFLHAVQIFAEVVREIPEAKLLMLGKGESSAQTDELRAEIDRLGLTENVVVCGYFKDIRHFYAMSSVYLTTSYHESFSMALIESRACGIPSVAYELPNLDIFDEKEGVIIVSQGDKTAAARAIIQLLSDQEFRIKKGMEARQSTEIFFKKHNVIDEWSKVLSQKILLNTVPVAQVEDNEEIYLRMFKTILLHYGLGLGLPDAPNFNPNASQPQGWPLPAEVLRGIENLTDHPDYVMHYEGEDLVMVHPIDDVPALGCLRNACPAGTRHIQAEVEIAHPKAAAVDFAMIVTNTNTLLWQPEIQQFTGGFCTEWVSVPAATRSMVHLFLPAPLEADGDVYLATRLKPGENNAYCSALFRNIRITI